MTDENKADDKENWLRMVFKGNKVWAEKGPDGKLLQQSGRVRVKYNLTHNQEYLVNPVNLVSVDNLPEKLEKKKTPRIKPKEKESDNGSDKKTALASSVSPDADHDPDSIIVYTDGASSGNPGPSGIGVYFAFGRHEKEISEYIGEATNNIAELEAIRRALSEIKNHELPLKIYSDSSYAIGLITLNWKPKKNQELVAEIKKLVSKFKKIDFIKVEGHSGILGNERADKLATGAIEKYVKKKGA